MGSSQRSILWLHPESCPIEPDQRVQMRSQVRVRIAASYFLYHHREASQRRQLTENRAERANITPFEFALSLLLLTNWLRSSLKSQSNLLWAPGESCEPSEVRRRAALREKVAGKQRELPPLISIPVPPSEPTSGDSGEQR